MASKPSSGLQLSFDREYERQLPLLFHGPALLELANKGHSVLASYLLDRAKRSVFNEHLTYADFYEACHGVMWERYRSEYVYKNAIASKILLGRHSLGTTKFLTEFRVEQCKADVVLINGTSSVYEIKTELDSLDRLNSQLISYCRVFDRVYVVTHDTFANKLADSTADHIGILVLSDEYSFKEMRKAQSNKLSVSPESIFDSLRRDEYMQILKSTIGDVPNVPNTQIYAACKRLFCELTPEVAHDGMVAALRRRKPSDALKALVQNGPESLRAALLSAELSDKQVTSLAQALTQRATGKATATKGSGPSIRYDGEARVA